MSSEDTEPVVRDELRKNGRPPGSVERPDKPELGMLRFYLMTP